MTDLSTRGMIEIISHEGVCLDPYLDSVGVWTIGAGQTKSDGFDPKGHAKLSLQECFDLFKTKIKQYTDAVDALKLPLSQTQYDALTSFCYNVGPGNLRLLCGKGRTLSQIGDAIMLYKIPPEIIPRRQKEQDLFKKGVYSNTDGKVLVFPVANSKPQYSKGYTIDARPYFVGTQSSPVITVSPVTKPVIPAPVTPPAAKPGFWAGVLDLLSQNRKA